MGAGNVYIERLKQSGHRLTKARLTVLHALEEECGHITSANILEKVKQIDPAIGRASVFRALNLFTALGIIRPTYISASLTPTYVLMRGGHHHHVVCTSCNRFFEFEECGLETLAQNLEQTLSVDINGHLLEFYGLCAACGSQGENGLSQA